jgi:uncharacterized protein (TIGR02147 family)
MDVFESKNYRELLRFQISRLPKQGHGQAKSLARHLGISSTLVSQVLREQRHFTPDQAHLAAEFLGFSELESEYFLTLVQLERAANPGFRRRLENNLQSIRNQSRKLENRLSHQQALSAEQKAVFYSDWAYSAIRMLTSIPGKDSADSISRHLGLPLRLVNDTLHFLEAAGLVVREREKFRIGPLSTHLSADSPFVKNHHNNWRQKASDYMNYQYPLKLHYTSPMTLSEKDAETVRAILVQTIDQIGKVVDPSPAEQLMCLNVDWFRVKTGPFGC